MSTIMNRLNDILAPLAQEDMPAIAQQVWDYLTEEQKYALLDNKEFISQEMRDELLCSWAEE